MRQFIQNKPFFASLLLNLGLFLLFLGIFHTRYGTTDDVEMQMVLAGKGVLQEPSAYLRFTHIFVGQLVSSLYAWFPSLPWYGYYLTTAHFLGMSAILYSILLLKFSLFRVAAFVLCFALGETALLQELQYTSSSLIMGIGASFLLFTAIYKADDNRSKTWLGISFLMLMGVVMMRWDSFQLIVILTTPLLLYGIFQQSQKRLFHLVFCTSILVLGFGLNQLHYGIQGQDSSWSAYNEYKHSLAAHDILDYNKPQYYWDESSADDYFYKVGWEYEDLMIFKTWFFADSSVFGVKQFKALQETFQNCPFPPEYIEQKAWYFFIEFPLEDYVFYGFLMLALTLLFLKGNRGLYLTLGLSALMVFGILASLYIYKHLPPRVSYPMAFYLICLATLFMTWNKEIHPKTKAVALLFIGIMAISNLKMVTLKSSNTAFEKMYWSAALDSLDAQKEQLYIGGGDFYMQACMTPYQSTNDSLFLNFNMLDFGHLANSPTHYKQLENFGIENIHTQAPIDSNIYLIHRYDASFLKWYVNFVYRHYGLFIEYELIRKEDDVDIAIYQIREQIREKENSQGISLSNMHQFGIKPKEPKISEEDLEKPKAGYLELDEFLFAD